MLPITAEQLVGLVVVIMIVVAIDWLYRKD